MDEQINTDSKSEAPVIETLYTCKPPIHQFRNNYGLLMNENYIFNEDGSVDWRRMIKPEFLVPKKDNFEKKNKPVPTSIEGLEDKDLLILLGGIKDLARLRGYSSVRYNVVSPSSDYVIATCEIKWLPNYESQGQEVIFSGIGDAHPNNTTSFTRQYLGPMAENRAFVRAVRNFLKVPILGQEEIPTTNGNSSAPESSDDSDNILSLVMREHSIPFEKIKARLVEDKVEGADSFTVVSDIPRFKQLELVGRIKSKAAEKSNKSSTT